MNRFRVLAIPFAKENSENSQRQSKLKKISSLVILVVFLLFFSFSARAVSQTAEAASPPVVNGLFYGDGDYQDYQLYGTSEFGSELFIYLDDPTLYVALVVHRDVNDNVFSDNRDYTDHAGWGPPRDASRLTDSEFAGFNLYCDQAPNEWNWQQGYAEEVGGVWVSDETVSGGMGTPPPGYNSASSLAWNLNHYNSKTYPTDVLWDMYIDGATPLALWNSPFDPNDRNYVIGLDGYPASGPIVYSTVYEYEWPMVYEWSADLSVCGSNPIYVLSGLSHHSPSKNGEENDEFIPDPDPDPLLDYGDLPDSYSTTSASDGARHVITLGGSRLGGSPDPEADGQPSTGANDDDLNGALDEDGVTRQAGDLWQNGNTVGIELDVQGASATADVALWIDWDGDGVYQADEYYPYLDLATGTVHTVFITVPGAGDYTVGNSLYVRARVFNDEADAPGGSLDAGDYEGLGNTGEVEDHQWFFGPTAVTGRQINLSTPGAVFIPIMMMLLLVVTAGYLWHTGRRKSASS